MARTLLLLATFQLLPQLVLLPATYPAPAFSIEPWKDEYLIGDTVALTCSADPLPVPVTQINYYSDTGFAVTDRVSSGRKKTYNFNITGPHNAGQYYCAYYTGRPGHFRKSTHSASITIKVKDPPAEPTLSVNPPSREANEGHPLVITCTAPGAAAERTFHFYQQGAELKAGAENHIMAPDTPPWNVAVLSIPRADTNSSGEYSCGYEEKDSGRWIPSTRSQSVMVTLKGPPAEPTLSVDPPSKEVNEGHPLVITCTAPGNAVERRFHFYQHGAEFKASGETHMMAPDTPPWNVIVLRIPRADTNSSGEYSCGYEEKDSGRWIPSTRSQAVMVTLKGPLPPPVLTVNPSSGTVDEGLPLNFTCIAPEVPSEQRFHFYKNETKIDTSASGPELSIPQAGLDMAREFTCGYEEKVNGRWVASPRSQAVTVTVKGATSLPIPLVAGAAAGVLALVLLLLLLCLCVRKRKGSRWSINRIEKNGSISSYSPIPLASMNPDTF